ncbi:hypothetical protein PM082_024785 [Marasmius tenuissimus]|nr:hypothetical protein PM082_024785 [Marasmius tenuissimus]
MNGNQPTTLQVLITTPCLEYPRFCVSILARPVIVSFQRPQAFALAYGIHLVLFVTSISVFAQRRPKWFPLHCLLAVLLFVLATCSGILSTFNEVLNSQIFHRILSWPIAQSSEPLKFTLEEQVGPEKVRNFDDILEIPSVGLRSRLGLAMQAMTVTSNNLLLTSLIAGRVLYISRQVSTLNQRPVSKIYRTVIHASVESGVLYPMTLFIYTVLLLVARYRLDTDLDMAVFVGDQLGSAVLHSCLIPIMGIASTLIIVRTALGVEINGERSFRATVLGEGVGRNGETRGIVESVLDPGRPDRSIIPHDDEHLEDFEHARKIEEWVD